MPKNPPDQAGGLPALGEESPLLSWQNEGESETEMRPFGVSFNFAKPLIAQIRCGQSIIGGTRRISFGKSVSLSVARYCCK